MFLTLFAAFMIGILSGWICMFVFGLEGWKYYAAAMPLSIILNILLLGLK